MSDLLDELYNALDEIHTELSHAEEEADTAEMKHELAEATAALKIEGKNEMERKAKVTLLTKDEAWDLKVAKRKLSAARRKMKILELKIDIQRSRNANLRRVV